MSIVVDQLSKNYDEHIVVNQVSLDVADGECFVLLGPSGSGKSTVLRIIAGLVRPESGRVMLHGRDVTDLAPQKRSVGMVFQQYALFGHMTVAENVEFPLAIRKVPAAERRRRRDELLDLVGLLGFQKRFPHQLSGGQQQRVALVRALARRPDVLLLDEPFGALDARIRSELRSTLRAIQRELRLTTVFFTHDQDEAFVLADRMAVMNFGRLLEVGDPHELYLRPQTEFVATFLGRANLFVGECVADEVRLGDFRFPLHSRAAGPGTTQRVQVLFRPEDVAVKLTRDALDWPTFGEGVVEETEFSGSIERLRVRVPGISGVRPIAPSVPFGADFLLLEATRSQHLARAYPLKVGDPAWVGVRHVHALAHRGINLAVVDRCTDDCRDMLSYAGALARMCHAHVVLLSIHGTEDAGSAPARRDRLGSGLASLELRSLDGNDADGLARELERLGPDLVIVSRSAASDPTTVDGLMGAGTHHLLFAGRGDLPRRALICVAAGEPGKQGIIVAGRILRHLGVPATVLTACPEDDSNLREQVARFHQASLRTLSLYGVEASDLVKNGDAERVVVEEIERSGHDFIVVGTSLGVPARSGAVPGLAGLLLRELDVPTLVVRHVG
jgi:sulfate transport system ATP-binding protein